MIYAYEDL